MHPTSRSRRTTVAASLAGAVAGLVALTTPAAAHELPGAGALDGLTHPLLGPDHLLAMVAVGILAALVPVAGDRRSGSRVAWAVPAGFLAGMVAGGALGLTGVGFPAVELVIGGSVVVFGVLVATGLTRGESSRAALWLPALAALLGAAHGQAHGAEAPAAANAGLYVAGFVVATAALHLAGTGLGLALRRSEAARMAAGAGVTALGAVLLLGA